MTLSLTSLDFAHTHSPKLTALSDKVAAAQIAISSAYGLFGDRFAVVSSFGAESAVLLHITAAINPAIPVLFLDTGKIFGETKRYRDQLVNSLGLTNVITLSPDKSDLEVHDPNGTLWASQADQCCHLRKVVPFQKAVEGYQAWASGRKRYQSSERAKLPPIEFADNQLKINPLANWTAEDVKAYMASAGLPAHPLVKEGYPSIGCIPCTDKVDDSQDSRAGRWKGSAKTECGIHRPAGPTP